VNPIGGDKTNEESEADRFAMETLIPPDRYEDFRGRGGRPSALAVEEFASEIEIASSVVVGRLQHDEVLSRAHLNHLRRGSTS